MAKILLAEDEKGLSDAECAVLRHFGYEVDAVYDGAAAVERARGAAYDCMVFDIMMPKEDGVSALREIRAAGDVTPVILLTAKTEVDDRITGLDAGADDYLAKPFAMGELLARIRAQLRRRESYTPTALTFGSVSLDTEEQSLTAESAIRLSGRETKLMKFFLLNAGKTFTTEEIFRDVWRDEPDENKEVVWMYVTFLREKLASIHADVEIEGEKDGAFTLKTSGATDGGEMHNAQCII